MIRAVAAAEGNLCWSWGLSCFCFGSDAWRSFCNDRGWEWLRNPHVEVTSDGGLGDTGRSLSCNAVAVLMRAMFVQDGQQPPSHDMSDQRDATSVSSHENVLLTY